MSLNQYFLKIHNATQSMSKIENIWLMKQRDVFDYSEAGALSRWSLQAS